MSLIDNKTRLAKAKETIRVLEQLESLKLSLDKLNSGNLHITGTMSAIDLLTFRSGCKYTENFWIPTLEARELAREYLENKIAEIEEKIRLSDS